MINMGYKRRRCAPRGPPSPSNSLPGRSKTAPTIPLDWHDLLLDVGVIPIALYNARNTDNPKAIEYKGEDHIEGHSEDVQLKQTTLNETYNRHTGVERYKDAVRDCDPGHIRV